MSGPTRRLQAIPAPVLFVGSGFSQYLGAATAVGLFALLTPPAVAWWRVAVAAIVLLAWKRPWRLGLSLRDVGVSAIFGVAMTLMNVLFYLGIARAPMGTVVALEFLGPVAVALFGGRSVRTTVAACLAAAGVVAIGGLGVDHTDRELMIGLGFGLAAGVAWAVYIVVGRKIAVVRDGVASLAVGCLAGALAVLPFVGGEILPVFSSWRAGVMVLGVGILSTALPYSIEQVALARIPAPTFALLTALLPATSMLVGLVLLGQIPSWGEVAGLLLVSVAVWLASRSN